MAAAQWFHLHGARTGRETLNPLNSSAFFRANEALVEYLFRDERCFSPFGITRDPACRIRWSRMGVFDQIFAKLAGQAGAPDRLMLEH